MTGKGEAAACAPERAERPAPSPGPNAAPNAAPNGAPRPGGFWRRAARALRLASTAGPPFLLPEGRGGDPTGLRLRRAAAGARRRRVPPWARPAAFAVMAVGWPLRVLREIRALRGMPDWEARSAPERRALGRAMLRLGLRHGVAPGDTLRLGLGRPGAPPPSAWILSTDLAAVALDAAPAPLRRLAADKRAAREALASLGVAVPEAIGGVATDGRIERWTDAWPDAVISKPRIGLGGRGIRLWRRAEGVRTLWEARAAPGTACPEAPVADPLAWLAGRAAIEGEQLLEAAVAADPACPGARGWPEGPATGPGGPGFNPPPVIRAVTVAARAGPARLAFATVSWPAPGMPVSQGGPLRAVDPRTGLVGAIADAAGEAAIPGGEPRWRPIPGWPALAAGLARAHRGLPHRTPIIGWDVIPAETGAVVLEMNLAVSAAAAQIAGGRSLLPAIRPEIEAWLP